MTQNEGIKEKLWNYTTRTNFSSFWFVQIFIGFSQNPHRINITDCWLYPLPTVTMLPLFPAYCSSFLSLNADFLSFTVSSWLFFLFVAKSLNIDKHLSTVQNKFIGGFAAALRWWSVRRIMWRGLEKRNGWVVGGNRNLLEKQKTVTTKTNCCKNFYDFCQLKKMELPFWFCSSIFIFF